ncbi:MAG: HAMP domain-containing sensor histidine kinase [Sphingomonas sp.]
MIRQLKAVAKAHWPALTLRTILFGTLLFVAALPGVAALTLRVYENTIVQQTEAELIAQSAVLAATYRVDWLGGASDRAGAPLAPEPPTIDLRTMPILPPQPRGVEGVAPDAHAARVARAMLPVASDAAAVTLAATRILDARGTVVLGRDDVARNLAALPEVRAAMRGHSATVLRHRTDREPHRWVEMISRTWGVRLHHARPVLLHGRVIGIVLLSRTPRGLFLGLYQDRGKIIVGVALILLVLLVLAGLLSRGIARPIAALGAASREVALGRVEVPETPPTAAIEIAQLYDNFRIMAERIERRSHYLRDLAAAVSHEFKTPLAGIRGALELLDEHGATMSEAERRRFIANAAADAARLARLVQRLLDLARADMAEAEAGARADVLSTARKVADGLGSASFTIRLDGASPLPPAQIAPGVLETILDTLIENSRQAGAGAVTIGLSHQGDQIVIAVSDDGSGIAESDRERIFEPFFTARRDSGGTGMGLAIARSLLAAAGGTIELRSATGGALFVVTLPPAGPPAAQ